MTESSAKKPALLPVMPLYLNLPLSTFGGSFAWLFAHPCELVKNRFMLRPVEQGRISLAQLIREITAKDGTMALWKGIDAGIARQLVYATIRLGTYQPILDLVTGHKPPSQVTVPERIAAGALSGALGAFCSCPVEVALVRITKVKDGPSPSVLAMMKKIAANEGVFSFWNGCTPLLIRAAIVGVSQVAFYDQAKQWMRLFNTSYMGGSLSVNQVNVYSSVITGVFYSIITMPVEAARVRMMANEGKKSNTLAVIGQMFKQGGMSTIYRGFVPYSGRCTVHTIVAFCVIDLTKQYLGYRTG